jgi:DNA-binding transcriptional MerR regulator
MATRLKQTLLNFDFPEEQDPVQQVVQQPEEEAAAVIIEQATAVKAVSETVVEEPIEVTFHPKTNTRTESPVEKKSTRGRMKLSDMAATLDQIDVPDDEELFSKQYYPIGMVTQMFKVNHSLLRFWEAEFDILKPRKNGKGDRLFRPEDVKNLKLIYHLLRERKYTIEGAKEYLRKNKHAEKKYELIDSLKHLRGFLLELKATL